VIESSDILQLWSDVLFTSRIVRDFAMKHFRCKSRKLLADDHTDPPLQRLQLSVSTPAAGLAVEEYPDIYSTYSTSLLRAGIA